MLKRRTKMKNKIYAFYGNPNGTVDILITDAHGTVLDSMSEALFGNIPAKEFGWSGDALGNLDICYYGESVGMLSYDDENYDEISNGEISDIQQVIEVDIEDALDCIAVSPVSDGSAVIEFLAKHGFKTEEAA